MEIFWRFILGHFIADFTLQTNYIASWKRRSLVGLFVHVGIHPIIYSILLWNYLGQVWLEIGPLKLTGCVCVLLIFIAHVIEDEWRIWSVFRRGAPDNTFFYVWDQIIHFAVIFTFSPVVEGSVGKFGVLSYPPLSGVLSASESAGLTVWQHFTTVIHSETWVIIVLLYAIVTHFTTVTIYFIEKDFFGRMYPETQEKYISMAERVVLMSCFLLPSYWWTVIVGIWAGRIIVYKIRRIYDFSWTSILVGNVTAVLCGIFARVLIY